MRGCEAPPSGPDPFRAKTVPAYGKGHTFDFAKAAAEPASLGVPGVHPGHPRANEAAQAAVHIEVWDAPVVSCGDGPLLIGSAVLRLDKLVARSAKARASSVEMQTSVSLCRPYELNSDKARPSAGTLKLGLVLDKSALDRSHTHTNVHTPPPEPEEEEEEMM